MARRAIIRITPELLARALQLPDAYHPIGVFDDFQRMSVCLVVEHRYLREVDDGAVLPEITPRYKETVHRDVILDHVEGGPL